MKVEIKDTVLLVITTICFLLFGIAFETKSELDDATQAYEIELYQTKEQLNVVKDELGKAKHHIWLLNKEREAE